ncbi:uncharacterized protein KNAG_0C02460 [Huiozyma naganishii CBS 8797]|uniref:Cell wall mannoprotein PIR1-like C-terminal domain-containing protein n=1 Tax=Huiozyma naganishii (strain ATCC MYA-139 / BCRC 22969 / CBS 8797 / KCTC 17520 / NBRC 10181 / NCYC 3082 / Yp74L-3) TaxID=1071383 RepID=J7RWH6_HUIN7|nr:hypothetical protein KNAG_0C02460 [Kazachstania naganishii CBS 8797]CCK69357.1 hypothetical protein KNAG_0C02460 [Kazachstania naganishii CBS 8797]
MVYFAPKCHFKNGITEYASTFGIAVKPVASAAKRDAVSQINDGQVQATTKTLAPAPVSQIGDGQIQATTKTAAAAPVSQIGDGQIQAATKTAAAAPVSQIGDGQIQAATKTAAAAPVSQIGDGQIQAATKTLAPAAVSQIGDGQIQAATKTLAPAAVSQIGDGQIQAATKTAQAVSQIGDGQIQATTKTAQAASQITDGQVQATKVSNSTTPATPVPVNSNDPVRSQACKSSGTLQMNIHKGILTDGHGRIGSIVSNRQFQFDGPPPQAGAIYAAGWSLTPEGNLAIGDQDTFYQCLSGNFYNLYDKHIGSQCTEVHLEAIDLVNC